MKIERLTGDAGGATTFYVDKCFLQLDCSSIPDAWSSCRDISSYYEAGTEGKIPYIDFDDIPGDLPAEILYHFEKGSGGNEDLVYLSLWDKSSFPETDSYWLNQTGSADASRTGDTYNRTALTTSGYTTIMQTISLNNNLAPGTYMAILCAKISSGQDISFYMTYDIGDPNERFSTKAVTYTMPTSYMLCNLGVLNYSPEPNKAGTETDYDVRLNVLALANTTAANLDADFYMFMPVHKAFIYQWNAEAAASDAIITEDEFGTVVGYKEDPSHNQSPPENIYSWIGDSIGNWPRLQPQRPQRMLRLVSYVRNGGGSDEPLHDLHDYSINIRYRPRTEFFL
jgi:hypothetical protein